MSPALSKLITIFNPHNNSVKVLPSTFYRAGIGSTEVLGKLPIITQLINGVAGIPPWVCLNP